VTIGQKTLVAAYAYFVGGDHEKSVAGEAVLEQRRRSAGISAGDGAWIGAGATIFDGVTIGHRAVVGASAVVRDDVPDGATAVGIPAKLVQKTSGVVSD
jgi:acetyltransferase-like isoleucine patch superfamily enzyme